MSSQAKACMHVQCSVTPPRVARGAFFPPLCSLMVRIRCTVVAVFNDVCVCVCVCVCVVTAARLQGLKVKLIGEM